MEYQIARVLPLDESDLITGKSYIELIAKELEKSNDDLLIDLEKYILNDSYASQREREFFNFIIELISLTFVIYKWGLLLFHIDNQMFGNFILFFEIDKKNYLATEENGEIKLRDITDNSLLFSTINQKSLVAQLLIDLITRGGKVSIVEVAEDNQKFDGSRVSYSEKRSSVQKDEIALIRSSFSEYKKRLENLQKIFVDNFGKPRGFTDQ